MNRTILEKAHRQDKIRKLDFHLGLLMERLADQHHSEVRLATTLTSIATSEGNTCLALDDIPSYWQKLEGPAIPDLNRWRSKLLATCVVGKPGELAPLILDEKNRLYFYRYYHYEEQITENLLRRANGLLETDIDKASTLLASLFPVKDDIEQKTAAAHAVLKKLLIISGGAGTGKTHTVTRILALLQGLSPKLLSIELAAPTGKAAARLREAIYKEKCNIKPELTRNIPDQAKTLHRLLGFRPNSDDFIYNQENQLNIDLLVVDEASMIDIAMMNTLLKALPESARLILLGDHHQLASIEAGNLFSDLCGTHSKRWSDKLNEQIELLTGSSRAAPSPAATTLSDSFSLLEHNYRQDALSGIFALSQAVKHGSTNQVTSVLNKTWPDLRVIDQHSPNWTNQCDEEILTHYEKLTGAATVKEAFEAMEQFRVLCALNDGPFGVSDINNRIEQLLSNKRLLSPGHSDNYRGKPIIILENQYPLQLFNGDAGILWEDPDDNNKLKAWFRYPDSNELYCISVGRLPAYACAYAITVHKSQGSEYKEVLLLLPNEGNRVLSRELLYTGTTRAQEKLTIYCQKDILEYMIKKPTDRRSGLYDNLWP